jgi:hypothetical protein
MNVEAAGTGTVPLPFDKEELEIDNRKHGRQRQTFKKVHEIR